MPTIELNGKVLARQLEQQLAARISTLVARTGRVPILATILVGDDPASATYVAMKGNACIRVGMDSRRIVLPETTTTTELLKVIDGLNADPDVHGILLQHPVPHQIDERQCFDRIALHKDVDGVTALGFGSMALGKPAFGSATPAGIMTLLTHHAIETRGRLAVVVGRSPILGKPMAQMLLQADATVLTCHSRTQDLPALVRQADIVVGAVGKREFIRNDWIRDGAVVVDAGYHPGGVGDIELSAGTDRFAAFTPVPGGVGPMTIATLISQTVLAAEGRRPVFGPRGAVVENIS